MLARWYRGTCDEDTNRPIREPCGRSLADIRAQCGAATISGTPTSSAEFITVTGRFETGDDDKLSRALLEAKDKSPIVSFDSPGGVLQVGLSMGRALQFSNAIAVIRQGNSCASACGLAWLGSSRRALQGNGRWVSMRPITPVPTANPWRSDPAMR